jgi:outer membrane protein assembly factor BamB
MRSPIVVGDRVYVFSRRGDNEGMSAHDGATGRELWRVGYSAPFTMNSAATRHNAGPKSTPIYVNGRLISIGMTGVITAWDAPTGRQIWQKPGSLPVPLYTSHAFSPLVDGNSLITVGGHDKGALTAFDVATGDIRWSWTGDGPGTGRRSSPPSAARGGSSLRSRKWSAWTLAPAPCSGSGRFRVR